MRWAAVIAGAMLAGALPVVAAGDGSGSVERGAVIFDDVCSACHSLESNRTGPRLGGVYGRVAGSVPGFAYSRALNDANFVWDEETLDKWLSGPREFLKGARMPIDLDAAADRADVIAYLRAKGDDAERRP